MIGPNTGIRQRGSDNFIRLNRVKKGGKRKDLIDDNKNISRLNEGDDEDGSASGRDLRVQNGDSF